MVLTVFIMKFRAISTSLGLRSEGSGSMARSSGSEGRVAGAGAGLAERDAVDEEEVAARPSEWMQPFSHSTVRTSGSETLPASVASSA
jgi:hypothetical protein